MRIFFSESVDSPDLFRFFTDMTDPVEIEKYVKTEGADIVCDHMADIFARHRWLGGQEVGECVGLLAGTHDLARQCIPIWLGKTASSSRKTKKTEEEAVPVSSGYGSDDEPSAPLVPWELEAPMDCCEKEDPLPANASADFFEKKKQLALDLASYNSRAFLLIFVIVNRYMNRGLRHKLYIAGERFDHDNDKQTAAGGARRYRITEAAHNGVEVDVARSAVGALCDPSVWDALSDEDKTLDHRVLATMCITKQQGSVIINLTTRHEMFPHLLFNAAIYLSYDDQQRVANLCQCLWCDFSAYWLNEHPGVKFSEEDSIISLVSMAEDIKTETTNSENAHAYWQQCCRLRSICTDPDALETVSCDSLFAQNRRYEAELPVTAEPKKLGRRPKPELRKTRKQKKKKKSTAKAKKPKVGRFGGCAARNGGWGAYRLFVKRNKKPGEFGPVQFEGLKEKYAVFKTTLEFPDFARIARSMTYARAADPNYIPLEVSSLGRPGADVACSKVQTLVPLTDRVVAGEALVVRSEPSTALMALGHATSQQLVAMGNGKKCMSRVATLIRSMVVKAGAESRGIKRAGDLALVDWTNKGTLALECEMFQNSVPVAGIEARPSGSSVLTRVLWKLPAAQLAEEIAKGMKEPRTEIVKDDVSQAWSRLNSHDVVRKRWASRHKMLVHDELPHLGPVRPSAHMSSLSRQCGMCLCGRRSLVLYRGAFLGVLKRLFVKSTDNPYKPFFETNAAVLRITWDLVDATVDDDPEVTV
jgi:hypothetical protein